MKSTLTPTLCALAFAGTAHAQTFPSFLEGSQEVPPTPSKALGFADFEFDAVTSTFDLFVVVDGIDVNKITGFHVHNAPAGVNGGIVVDLLALASFVPDPVEPMLSTYEIDDVALTPFLASELFAKNLYINLHTTDFQTGEIRGQIVPGPGGAVALAPIALLAARRRRR